ncbi:hypothetical protein H7849_17125 [Alloacidobacterium dinghuense]|uniref:Uncharacterized protein n=1 Tax=Alloacidobacterium dinghuense TaxID=2763107 RepID=A0A7G8BE58_9BACT|nr:hypothetical protein [Alloacidobacterium dinghuense]QNI30828.1 hypothetical protein H7849_17125 [Alloacidobacterium dinghuense]
MNFPFDQYDLRARIFPALIVSIPAMALVYAVAPTTRNPFGTAGIGTLLEGAVLFLLGRIARDRGVKQQKRLFDRWGGPPTTRILRHENSLLDPLTKARLKITLQTLCGLTFPSEVEEKSDPARADMIYSSAIKALLEHRRDTKQFRLCFNENCNYGFARNLYGIRWLGIVVASICIASGGAIFRGRGFSFLWVLSAAISIAVLLLLVLYINADFVKRSAEAYAVALLRSCEPQKAKKAPTKKAAAES